jgi:hypothetical protein
VKRLSTLLIFIIGLLFFTKPVFAGCSVAIWDEKTRQISVCADKFKSTDDAKKISVEFTCIANSNTVDASANVISNSFCRFGGSLTTNTFTVPLSQGTIQTGTDNNTWGCVGVNGLARAIGSLDIRFKKPDGTVYCSLSNIITKPSDWNMGTEGLPTQGENIPLANVCTYANNDAKCIDCVINKKGIWTALGCIETDFSVLISKLLGIGMGLAGGIAFLLILLGGFQIMVSAGNPEQMNAGKELVSSAIAGLLLIIFSVFLLRLIGVNILGIPGFG